MKNEIVDILKKFSLRNGVFEDESIHISEQDCDKVADKIMLAIDAKFHLVDKINNEAGKELIIRLTELRFCKKDIERISGRTRQYVHKIIKEEYVKQGEKK